MKPLHLILLTATIFVGCNTSSSTDPETGSGTVCKITLPHEPYSYNQVQCYDNIVQEECDEIGHYQLSASCTNIDFCAEELFGGACPVIPEDGDCELQQNPVPISDNIVILRDFFIGTSCAAVCDSIPDAPSDSGGGNWSPACVIMIGLDPS